MPVEEIWRDYALLVLVPVVAGTVLLILSALIRASVGWWING